MAAFIPPTLKTKRFSAKLAARPRGRRAGLPQKNPTDRGDCRLSLDYFSCYRALCMFPLQEVPGHPNLQGRPSSDQILMTTDVCVLSPPPHYTLTVAVKISPAVCGENSLPPILSVYTLDRLPVCRPANTYAIIMLLKIKEYTTCKKSWQHS